MGGYNSTYIFAKSLFEKAQDYDNMAAKSSYLKKAWNAAYGLPDDFDGKNELLRNIEKYAYRSDIDLDKISGY